LLSRDMLIFYMVSLFKLFTEHEYIEQKKRNGQPGQTPYLTSKIFSLGCLAGPLGHSIAHLFAHPAHPAHPRSGQHHPNHPHLLFVLALLTHKAATGKGLISHSAAFNRWLKYGWADGKPCSPHPVVVYARRI
jgi:hypothetical protein